MLNEAFETAPQVIPALGLPSRATVGLKGEVLVCATRPRWFDLNYNKRLFHGTVGAVAGVSLNGATTLAQTSAIVLTNPLGSGVNAAIKRAVWQYLSGTTGLCGLYWAYCNAASTGGTVGAVTGGMLAAGRNACAVYTGGTSFSVTSVLLRPSGISLGAWVGTGTGNPQPPAQELVEDDIIVSPGNTCGLVAIGAAGTSDKSILSISWSEDPI